VDRHQDLLRVGVAYAGNDHRLGANEAPPAIISVFLGDQLTDVLEQIAATGAAKRSNSGGLLGLGVRTLPNLPKHAGDRNRTSPFAFTGNKFEFRALGGSQSISFSATVLNTIMAESVDELVTALESEVGKGVELPEALRRLLAKEIASFKRIIFNGDNYSGEWAVEAERRGLLNLKNTMDALPKMVEEKNVALFEKYHVLSRRELESRHEIALDQYFKTVNIEGETLADMASTMVLPAAVRYLSELLQTAERAEDVGVPAKAVVTTATRLSDLLDELRATLDTLVAQNAELGGEAVHEKAHHMRDHVIPAMAGVRRVVDKMETLLPDDLWPVPTYRDMLFVK
jgi:glutamine synthetase